MAVLRRTCLHLSFLAVYPIEGLLYHIQSLQNQTVTSVTQAEKLQNQVNQLKSGASVDSANNPYVEDYTESSYKAPLQRKK